MTDSPSDLADRLAGAVTTGDTDTVRACLERGAAPDSPGPDGLPLLCTAVARLDHSTAEVLVDGGADQDRELPDGSTPLLRAVDTGSPTLVSTMLGTEPRLRLSETSRQQLLDLARHWFETGVVEELRHRTGSAEPAVERRVDEPLGDTIEEVSLGGRTVRDGHGAILTHLEWAFGLFPPLDEVMARVVPHARDDDSNWFAATYYPSLRRGPRIWAALTSLRQHPDPLHRYFLAQVMWHRNLFGTADRAADLAQDIDFLASWAQEEPDGRVLAAVLGVYTGHEHPEQEATGLRYVGHPDPRVRGEVVWCLSREQTARSDAATSALLGLVHDPAPEVRASVAQALDPRFTPDHAAGAVGPGRPAPAGPRREPRRSAPRCGVPLRLRRPKRRRPGCLPRPPRRGRRGSAPGGGLGTRPPRRPSHRGRVRAGRTARRVLGARPPDLRPLAVPREQSERPGLTGTTRPRDAWRSGRQRRRAVRTVRTAWTRTAGAADVAFRVADLARAHGGRLHAEVAEEQDRGGGRRPAEPALAGRVEGAEIRRVEGGETGHRGHHQGDELEDGGNELDGADVPGPGQVGERGQPLDGERAGEGEAGGPAEGPQHVEVSDGGDGEGGVADPGGDPVRPGGQEAGEVTESLARVDVRAAGARVAAREPAEDQGQGDRPDRQHGEGDQADRPVGRHGGGDQPAASALAPAFASALASALVSALASAFASGRRCTDRSARRLTPSLR